MTILPYLLALAFAVAYWRQRSRLNRCRMVAQSLSEQNRGLIRASAEQCRLCAVLRRELNELKGANLTQWESAHYVGLGGESRIVDAFNDLAKQPVRMFGGSFGREQS